MKKTVKLCLGLLVVGLLAFLLVVYACPRECVIWKLKHDIAFEEEDEIALYDNGYLNYIDVKRPETAERLFVCIQNAKDVYDLTDASLSPEPLCIAINGETWGDFTHFYYTHPITGRFLCFSFTEVDAQALKEYVRSLCPEVMYAYW